MDLSDKTPATEDAPETDRRKSLQRELTAQRLLPAVEGLLQDKAWGDIAVDEIASAAGVSRTLFYNHFSDKTDLLEALTTDVLDRIAQAARVVWMLPPDAEKSYFRDAWAYLMEEGLRKADLLEALSDAARTNARARETLRARVDRGSINIERHIRKSQAMGVHRPDIDAVRTALWLDWMIEWGLSHMMRSGLDIDRLIDAMTDVYWKATH